MVRGGLMSWFVVVRSGSWWFVVVHGGSWWFNVTEILTEMCSFSRNMGLLPLILIVSKS